MLYCFTGSDKDSQKNLNLTIYNKINLSKYKELLTDEEIESLKKLDLLDGCYMWGAKPGPDNIKRWNKVENGDKIIGYSQKRFICYGTIVYKMHNERLAEAIWGRNKEGATWEYINIFTNMISMNIPKRMYCDFFHYSEEYKPQGFTNINSNLFNQITEEYGSIDAAISKLCKQPITPYVIEEDINDRVTNNGVSELENSIYTMSDKEFKKYILSLDSSASIELINKYVKVRKYNKKIIVDMKKKAEGKCQICGCGCEHGVSIVEAHHIDLFSISQDNTPDNILIVCPNHHRLIHKTKAAIDIINHIIEYPDGTSESYKSII